MNNSSNGNYADYGKVPEQHRKVFVGGLDVKTTDEALKSYFEKYGEIVDYVVVTHPVTKRPRGFGFVTFKDPSSVDAVQAERPHKVEGRLVETKRAMPKEDDGKPESKAKVNKLFVGGVKEEIGENHLRDVFSEFGNITNIHVVTERGSNKKRGFAFVEFDDYDPVDKAVLKKVHSCGQAKLECKKALSKQQMDDMKKTNDNQGYGGNQGGYGGGGYNDDGGYSGGNQRGGNSYGSRGGGGGWGMSYADDSYDQGANDGYNNYESEYDSSYNAGPMRSGNNFYQRNQGPYGGGRGGSSGGGASGGRGGRGGGGQFRRF